MGDFEEEQVIDPLIPRYRHRSKPSAIIMLFLGLFAPMLAVIISSTYVIQSIFWMYRVSVEYPYGLTSVFEIIPLYALFSFFPVILLRLAPVYQIYRYYNGKTTRRRALISTLAGDGLFLFISLIYLFFSVGFLFVLYVPLPFQIIFGLIILWRYQIPIPITPWEDLPESESWWDKTSELKEEKTHDAQQQKPDDDDQLW